MKKACIGVGFFLIWGLIWMTRGTVRAEPATLPVFTPAIPSETIQAVQNSMELPIVLGNAGLIVTDIISFEGTLPGEKEEVYQADVAALLVYNPQKTGIVSATISLTRGAEILYFDLEYLPGGSKALVLERNAKNAGEGKFDGCTCPSFVRGEFDTKIPGLQITEENGYLTVKNLSDSPLPPVTVYYKQYTPDDSFYVGKVMSVTFDPLLPGESQTRHAYGFAEDYSRIAAVVPNT